MRRQRAPSGDLRRQRAPSGNLLLLDPLVFEPLCLEQLGLKASHAWQPACWCRGLAGLREFGRQNSSVPTMRASVIIRIACRRPVSRREIVDWFSPTR